MNRSIAAINRSLHKWLMETKTKGDVWAVVLDPTTGGGCSTLDLLKRIPYENAAEPSPFATDAVRVEMESIAQAKRLDQDHRLQSATKKGHVATIDTLGERLNRPKQLYIPGTPVERKLRVGRLVRTDDRDAPLASSRSAPVLITKVPFGTDDALDQAVQQQRQQQPTPSSTLVTAFTPQDLRITELRDQRQQLEHQLLHVTQKLCRKYTKQLFPRPSPSESPDRTKHLAEKWATSDTMTESEKYTLYMGSRFTTQQQRDFYRRDLESREPENDRHKRETIHTKYGDALVRSKHSLRANF